MIVYIWDHPLLSLACPICRQHLKKALGLASQAQDNHLRALTLALVSAHYLHTAEGHARDMLNTCEQLAAGLGAGGKSERSGSQTGKRRRIDTDEDDTIEAEGVGNAPLRLWVGERVYGEC